jgi:preprotein translocase subunit SecD
LKERKLKLITEILAIIVICLISFVGIYTKNANRMENQVKDYDLSKDLKGYRELVFKVSDATEVLDSNGKVVGNTDEYGDSSIETNSYQKSENKINASEDLTKENYEKAKSIIEKRLKSLNVEDYNLSLDEENGNIYLQIPENSDTDHTVSNILQVAKFEIKDQDDKSNVLVTNDDLKKISAVYNTTSSGTTVYLQIEFNKNGKNILKQISTGDYATDENLTNTTNTTGNTSEDENTNSNENTSSEEETKTQKKIILSIDNNDMITTSFDDPIEDGIMDLSMNQATTDQDSISDTLQSASTIAAVVNSGKMPLTYKVAENNYVNTDITSNMLKKAMYVVIAIVIVALVVLIIKYKSVGLLASISYIGFVGLELLLIRYTNVTISLESIVAGIILLAINYLITYRLIKVHETDSELKKKVYSNEFKSIIIKSIPIFIIAIVFVFMKWTKIATFGMFMFWGLLLSIIYNYIVTKDMLD